MGWKQQIMFFLKVLKVFSIRSVICWTANDFEYFIISMIKRKDEVIVLGYFVLEGLHVISF